MARGTARALRARRPRAPPRPPASPRRRRSSSWLPRERDVDAVAGPPHPRPRSWAAAAPSFPFPLPGPPLFREPAPAPRSLAAPRQRALTPRAGPGCSPSWPRPPASSGRSSPRTCSRPAVIALRVGEEMTPEILLEALDEGGYRREDPVTAPGQMARRGGILDVFPSDRDAPVRIEFSATPSRACARSTPRPSARWPPSRASLPCPSPTSSRPAPSSRACAPASARALRGGAASGAPSSSRSTAACLPEETWSSFPSCPGATAASLRAPAGTRPGRPRSRGGRRRGRAPTGAGPRRPRRGVPGPWLLDPEEALVGLDALPERLAARPGPPPARRRPRGPRH